MFPQKQQEIFLKFKIPAFWQELFFWQEIF